MRHLYQQQPHSAGSRVDQRRFALHQRIRVVDKIVRRYALQHGRGSLALADSVWNLHQTIRWHRRILRVTSQHTCIGDAISHSNVAHIGAESRNHASAFLSQNKRQWDLVAPFAVVNIDEVDARRLYLHDRFVRIRLWHGEVR